METNTKRGSAIVSAAPILILTTMFSLAPLPTATLFADDALSVEPLEGEGVWVSPAIAARAKAARRLPVVVWFDRQFLGDGKAYARRAAEFKNERRTALRKKVVAALQKLSRESYAAAKADLDKLLKDEVISNFTRHWIVSGFTCTTTPEGIEALKKVAGVKKIFLASGGGFGPTAGRSQPALAPTQPAEWQPNQYEHPWYVDSLQANRVWKTFGVTGKGALNIVHDNNFLFSRNIARNVYRNPDETPDNGKDDDGNGLIDDVHGFNFRLRNNRLTMRQAPANRFTPQLMHGSMCAAIICGAGDEQSPYQFGIAPDSKWAGVIAGANLEEAVEWAILENADTYSMSFSIPGLGETRSHWRKVMEHGSFCGVYFVSGAGNFAQSQPIPVQMRVPEDIPAVVFAAAGVQRDFTRTPFSSKGPVEWNTEHYHDGRVQKPEVCAFNMGLPVQMPDGKVRGSAINGNSFAGPMFCGAIALMLDADPDLLPWDLRAIITQTATDVAEPGVDDETGHGLINCYRAVREVLRRRAIREGEDATRYEGREPNDELDIKLARKRLGDRKLVVSLVQSGSPAAKAGVKQGDVVVRINDKEVSNAVEFTRIRNASQGKPMKLKLKRKEETLDIELKPGRFGIALAMTYAQPVFSKGAD